MDSTLALMAPGEPICPASPFMMQDINFTSVNAADTITWDFGHIEQLLPLSQSQGDLRASIAQILDDGQHVTPASQPSTSARTIFGWRPTPSSTSLHPPAALDGTLASSTSCLDMFTDALAPRKPKYKPAVSPGRMRIEQACEPCRSRKAKCDGGKPCERCKDRGVSCAYKANKPTRSRRNSSSELATEMRGFRFTPGIPDRTSSRKTRSAPAPLHLVQSFLEPSQTPHARRATPSNLPFREPPSAASSTGSFMSGWSTASSSARSTPLSADFPEFASSNIEGSSGMGAMRHSRQTSRAHPYHAPATSNRSSFYDSSAPSFIDGLPPSFDSTGWAELQFPPQPVFEQLGDASFVAAGDELSDLFNFCTLPMESFAALPGDAPLMLNLSSHTRESSNECTDPFAGFESSLMLEFAQALNTASADEESSSMGTTPAESPESS